jgi:hypothetical protein
MPMGFIATRIIYLVFMLVQLLRFAAFVSLLVGGGYVLFTGHIANGLMMLCAAFFVGWLGQLISDKLAAAMFVIGQVEFFKTAKALEEKE